MNISPELPVHRPAVLELNRLAFKGDEESRLIKNLARDNSILASFVALDGGEVVGHILFSPLHLTVNGKRIDAVALAPMCVVPSRQKQGIGTLLVEHGIEAMKSAAHDAIIVLGHVDFYPRFGFRHDLARNLACAFNQYEAFMGLELRAGSLGGKPGTCTYARAFA
ncbi:MAG: N-acetyltransferase [Aestuariivirga sp.]|nr:N-acetyltransferase [Aestuariivirga sp.]